MSQKVIVIGGGIVGCISAIELSKKGAEVSIIDQSLLCNEASKAAGGILFPLMPWNYEPNIFELCSNSISYYEKLAKDLLLDTNIDIELIRSGIQILPPFNEVNINKWCKKNNMQIFKKRLNNEDTLLIKDVFQVNPPKLMKAINLFIKKLGIKVFENSEVIKLNKSKNKITSCEVRNNGKIYGDKFIIAAGAWSSKILKNLSKKIYPVRGHIIQYSKSSVQLEHILFKNDIYVLQRKDQSIIVGSTLENVGFSNRNTKTSVNFLNKKAIDMIEELRQLKIEKHWYGFRSGSEANKPLVRIDNTFDNLILNTGHHRYGITMAPNTASSVLKFIYG